MDQFPVPLDFFANRQALAWLLVPFLMLPIGMSILFIFGQIFALLNDPFSASILNGAALTLGIMWCLICVVLLLCTVLVLLRESPKE